MAYVAISGEFIERVKHKIIGMRNAEVNTLGSFNPKVSPDSDLYLSTVWAEYVHLRKQIPNKWKRRTESLYVSFKINGKSVNHTFSLTTDGEAPPYHDAYRSIPVDATHPEMAETLDYYARKLEIENRWDSVNEKVVEFLRQCKSLNEAAKLWPDITMYIDKRDLDRMNVKAERSKTSAAAEALKNLNTDELVGAAVIARMSGAEV